MDTATFVRDFLAPIIGAIAFLQFWIKWAIDRFYAKPTLSLHPTGKIEFGFGAFGNTLAFLGTLRASNKPVFVNQMRASAKRQADGEVLELQWLAFRGNEVMIDPQQKQTQGFEIASPFQVRPDNPHKYNIFFYSPIFENKLKEDVQPLRNEWAAFVARLIGNDKIDADSAKKLLKTADNPALVDKLVQAFIDSEIPAGFLDKIESEFFWIPGEYLIELTVDNDGQPSKVSQSWKIHITERESTLIRKNRYLMIKELCGITTWYNFLYKPIPNDLEQSD